MDENARLLECPRCQNEEFSVGAKFCRICGLPLYNRCTDDMCKAVNPANARFCEFCGAPTLFNVMDVLRPYDQQDSEEDNDDTCLDLYGEVDTVDDDELPF